MDFRIGINLGDVVVKDEVIYGDGVNLAARLETLAEPGGICISRPVHDQVKSRLKLEFDYLGAQKVKNIEEPVRAYRILTSQGHAADRGISAKRQTGGISRKFILSVASVVCLGIVVAVGWSWLAVFKSSDRLLASPERPSIAVLHFDNLSGGPAQEFLGDGISENIITQLAKVSRLLVIARNSSFAYKGRAVNVRQIGRELGVRYVLEGSVQKSLARVRINAQLIDTETGEYLWAEKYDRELESIFELQDEITDKVVLEVFKGMEVRLTEEEVANIEHDTTRDAGAWAFYTKGMNNYRRTNAFNNAQARKFFTKALELDPVFEAARLGLGWTYYSQPKWHWATGKYPYPKRKEYLKTATEIAQGILQRNKALAEPSALLGQINMGNGASIYFVARNNPEKVRPGLAGKIGHFHNPKGPHGRFHMIMPLIHSVARYSKQKVAAADFIRILMGSNV